MVMIKNTSRRRGAVVALVAAVLAALALQGGVGAGIGAETAVAQAGPQNVPKADCGPDDRTETGLQGQTTQAERLSGASETAYNCNLELVGQFQGEGASWQMAGYSDCAYYDTANVPEQERRGTVVVDASNPSDPQATAYLDDPAFLDPWESLKVNERRKLLGGTKGPGGGEDDRFFAFYDISDCADPELLSVLDVEGHRGHAGDFAPDGLTYYGTSTQRPVGHITAVDISDPTNPESIMTTREFRVHDVTLSKDGTRMYATQIGNFPPNYPNPNGLLILDVSDIQHRRPNPQIRVISELFWEDGSIAQVAQPIRIKGKPYLVFTDEAGSGGLQPAGADRACAEGMPPFGFGRLIDISDETNPTVVSKLMLEVHDPANCEQVKDDNRDHNIFAYDSHYCTVDDPNNATLVGCGYFGSGLRVFDIRDPHNPTEVAYYKPPAQRTKFLPGSQNDRFHADRKIDWSSSNVRFVRHKGELHIWFTSQDNGFQIVRATKRLAALTGRDFDQDHPGNRNN